MNSIFYCPGEERIFVTVFAGVDGILCFANEMSSATQELCREIFLYVEGMSKYCVLQMQECGWLWQ